MLFTSVDFGLLLFITACLYYHPSLSRFQIPTLIISSLYFYASSEPVLVMLLLTSVFINILSSYLIVYGSPDRRKFHATWGVLANLFILLFFKYSPLVGHTFFSSDGSVGEFLVSVPLPVGISFFTFQGISLVVDTYRYRDVADYRSLVVRNWWKHAEHILLFKSFFPQLVSGPIVKARSFLPQISVKRWQDIPWQYCFRTLVVGYFLKMVIADNLKDYTAMMIPSYFEAYSSLTLLTLLFGYSMQIFADFAGYSFIAIGLASFLGYQFPENFRYPYIAHSFSDFWRRWHISLSSFLRDYLYIPLGGNRRGVLRTYINLMLTMILGGLWHGAAWSYAVWGLAHGLALAAERFTSDFFPFRLSAGGKLLKGAFVFSYVTLAWLLFKLPEFSHVLIFLKSVTSNLHKPNDSLAITLVAVYSLPVLGFHLFGLLREHFPSFQWQRWQPAVYGLMLFMIITNSGSSGSFIYFQF